MKLKFSLLGLIFLLLTFMACPGMAAPPPAGKFFLVGLGPAGPEHTTLKALETIKKADLVLCHPELAVPFQTYLQGKEVFDPWKELWVNPEKKNLKPEERRELLAEKEKQRDEFIKQMKVRLSQGQNIALLTGGDPTVYSRTFWLMKGLDDDAVEIIPGLGAITASMAALKRASTGAKARFVLQTAARSFLGKTDPDDLARNLSKYNGTLVFYMGLKEIDNLLNTLKKYNPGDLPVAIVYYAGYPDKEKVVKGTLDTILAKITPEQEKWWGMIVVGRCLAGPGFEMNE
ncbi:SAM-dependent methyltransferase [Desulfobacca acetoxidans]|uniref:Uroporphyrin-III C/tetrapyrrole (Corrin/Porphyrin) methyltransferase n=1 Tax=Desulfobacca acetoxidans (strain ATCC 700848 / DSM 11109 / ASRB2) TaxID=880072 RepID=F2NJ08_DESAR|nr:SAM-dependent methyltransferase [Desulfobacca acetoxidans]AEB07966.1 Uroporphyrin-III C/tetrapyrrole (Corrin/Porphyrin) methyltransferase [Desulfobacca acetoxidans DSM 11109]